MNVRRLGGCGEGTGGVRRLVSIRFGDLLIGCDSNEKWSRRTNSWSRASNLFELGITSMRWALGIGTSLLILWLAYAVWPFFTVYRLADAVQARNVAAVSELVDFPALGRSLTAQIVRTYLRVTGKAGRPGSILEQFSVGVSASVADPIVAKLISPEALLDLLHNGRLSDVFPDNVPPIEGLSSEALGNVWRVYANSELGIARFFVAVPIDKPPVESFRLGFCLTGWRWKLCSAELPEQLQIRLAKEISKTEQR